MRVRLPPWAPPYNQALRWRSQLVVDGRGTFAAHSAATRDSGGPQMTNQNRRDGIQERQNSDGTITYRAQVRLRGHAPISKSFTRRTDAKRWIEETKTAIRNGTVTSTDAERTTLKEALERYLREVTPKKKGSEREG